MNPIPILVTGGAGYIGSHACKALAEEGFLPVAYDNLSTGHAYAVKWGPFIRADINDVDQLRKAFQAYQPKAVLHFAGSALVHESLINPGKYYQNNVTNTLNLLNAMAEAKVFHLVFSSSCAVYGDPQFNPITEAHPLHPISPYGRSKRMAEEIFTDFEKAHKIFSVKLRYFNAAGADFSAEIGENHTPETHLIPSIILTALGKNAELAVYGTDFPSRDGTAVRDYIHVNDLAKAHVLAIKWVLQNSKSAAINLGSGHGYSVLEIIDAVQKFCGQKIPVRFEKRRACDPALLTADMSLAKKLLGWELKFSDIHTVIESAWKWHVLQSKTDIRG